MHVYLHHQKEFLFTGLIKCPLCDRNLVGNYTTPEPHREYFSYRCNHFRQDRVCTYNQSTSEKKIEQQLLDNLEKYINNEIIKIESVTDNTPPNNNEFKIAKLKSEMERLNTMFRKGRIEEKEYDIEYMELEKQLKLIDVEDTPPVRNIDALKGLLETDYRGLYAQLDKQHKKAFLA